MPGLYLAALVVSIVGMTVLDARFRLFFWRSPWRAAVVMVVGVLVFLVWDVVGVDLGVFFIGTTGLLTGVLVVPDVPLEEVFFLVLLCYTTMDLVGFVRPVVARVLDRGDDRADTGRSGPSGRSGRSARTMARDVPARAPRTPGDRT